MPPQPQSKTDSVQDVRMGFISDTVTEIKSVVDRMEDKLQQFQLNYMKEHGELTSSTRNAHTRLDRHDIELSDLRKEIAELTKNLQALADIVKPMVITNRIISIIASLIGASLIALLWMIFTGRVDLIYH